MQNEANTKTSGNIEVVKVEFSKSETTSYQELFSGFDELYAITYSSSPDFIYNLTEMFKRAEIIFGSSHTLNNTATSILASQKHSIELIRKSKYSQELIDRVKDGELGVYLLKDKISHEKIYIMRNETQTRVIVGSANMSSRAFDGRQRENIVYMDEPEAYDYYKNLFEELKLTSTNEIDIKTIKQDGPVEIENTPLFGIIQRDKVIYLKEPESDDLIAFTTDVHDIDEDIKQYLPQTRKDKKTQEIKLTSDDMNKYVMKRNVMMKEKEEEEERERKVFPRFQINLESQAIDMNGLNFREWVETTYPKTTVKDDIVNMNNFVKGFDQFIGDYEHTKDCFWKLLTYGLASPVFAHCRKIGKQYGYNVWEFPMFGIIYGDANGGKTAMVQVLEQIMFGITIPDKEANSFTQTQIFPLKAKMAGIPIVINDLNKERWDSQVGNIVKNDSFELDPKYNPPVCLITSNEIKSLKPEISKRCIMLNVSAKLTDMQALDNSKAMKDILDSISPKFYLAFLDKFIPRLNVMLNNMEYGESPDIFKLSSEAILEVIREHLGEVPSYMYPLTKIDYFGELSKGYNALNELKKEFVHNQEAITIDRKRGIVEIMYENNYDARRIYNELPKSMNPDVRGKKLIVGLEQTEKFLKMPLVRRNRIATTLGKILNPKQKSN